MTPSHSSDVVFFGAMIVRNGCQSDTARIDPFRAAKTLNLNFFVHDPFTREAYSRDPRNVARKAGNYLASTGIADTAYFGAEAEFYIFDSVSFDSRMNGTFYEIDSEAGWWNTGEPVEADGSANRGYKVRPEGRLLPRRALRPLRRPARCGCAPTCRTPAWRLEKGHHEVGTAGQAEINYKFNTLLHAADDLQLYKYIIKNTAWQAGKSVTFMPKPLFGDNGSGMHAHQSLWKEAARCSTTNRATPAFRTPHGTTSAASCITRRRCWRSPTRR